MAKGLGGGGRRTSSRGYSSSEYEGEGGFISPIKYVEGLEEASGPGDTNSWSQKTILIDNRGRMIDVAGMGGSIHADIAHHIVPEYRDSVPGLVEGMGGWDALAKMEAAGFVRMRADEGKGGSLFVSAYSDNRRDVIKRVKGLANKGIFPPKAKFSLSWSNKDRNGDTSGEFDMSDIFEASPNG
jgi:hypothetical protein